MHFPCADTNLLVWGVTFITIFGIVFAIASMRFLQRSWGLTMLVVFMFAFAVRPNIVKLLAPACPMPVLTTPDHPSHPAKSS